MILDGVEIDITQKAKIQRDMSNWIKIADKIYKEATENDLLQMMVYEGNHKNRGYVIERLHSRYNALRIRREKKELQEWRQNLKK
jgi:hypothetical protein